MSLDKRREDLLDALGRCSDKALSSGQLLACVSDRALVEQVINGTYWFMALAQSRTGHLLALAPQADSALDEWPVVVIRGPHATTLSSSLATALPMWLYLGVIRQHPKRWASLREGFGELVKGLTPLVEAMGGRESLDEFASILFDPVFENAAQKSLDRVAEQDMLEAELLRRLDPSSYHVRHVEYALSARIDLEAPFPPPDTGPFYAATTSVGFGLAHRLGRPEQSDFAWLRWNQPECLDTSVGLIPELAALPPARVSQNPQGFKVADSVSSTRDAPWAEDLMAELAKRVSLERKHYSGTPHADAAKAMNQAHHQVARAWMTLMSAAYWSFLRMEMAHPSILESARSLAQQDGWSDMTQHLSSLAEAGDQTHEE